MFLILYSSFLKNRRFGVVLDGKYQQEYPANARFRQDCILGPRVFLPYINDLLNDVICNIAIYAYDTTLFSECDQLPDL